MFNDKAKRTQQENLLRLVQTGRVNDKTTYTRLRLPQTSQRQEDFRFARGTYQWVELELQIAFLHFYLAIFLDFISLSYLCGAVIIAAASTVDIMRAAKNTVPKIIVILGELPVNGQPKWRIPLKTKKSRILNLVIYISP